MSAEPVDFLRVQRDDSYLRDLEAEAAYWDQPQIYSFDVERPVVDAYINERFTGDERTGCFDTIPRYGTFRRGCSFGSGSIREEARMLEANPELHLTFYDISAESLAERERTLGQRFPGRVETVRMDMNFVELPENTFDLIVSAGCLHHLENLEHVAYQINRTLTPEGHFFLYDYVGPARFQFPAHERRFFEATIEHARERHPVLQRWRVSWSDPNDWEHSAFEALHPEETLGILRSYLDEQFVRPGGSLIWLLLWLRPADHTPRRNGWWRLLSSGRLFQKKTMLDNVPSLLDVFRDVAPDLLWLDSALTDTGLFQPWDVFAAYKKRGGAAT
jgi:SAM-dependent methyltransferase